MLLNPSHFESHYSEPSITPPEVYIIFPEFKYLNPIVTRMKKLHRYIKITADMARSMTFKIENDNVDLQACFTQLQHPQVGTAQEEDNPDTVASLTVDSSQLLKSLNVRFTEPHYVIGLLNEQNYLVLHCTRKESIIVCLAYF